MLDAFVNSVQGHFGYLATEYGFTEGAPAEGGYECTLTYRKPDGTTITAFKEAGSAPIIVVGAAGRDFELGVLIRERCPERAVRRFYFLEITHEQEDQVLGHYARTLREFGHDILSGAPTGLSAILERRRNAPLRRTLDDWVADALWSSQWKGRTVTYLIKDIERGSRKRYSVKGVERSLAKLAKRNEAVLRKGRWFPLSRPAL